MAKGRRKKKKRSKRVYQIKKAVYHPPEHKSYRVRSRGEKTVEEWFHKNKVQHIYEPRSKEYGGFVPDWITASGHIVEYFGYHSKAYRKKTRYKMAFFYNTLGEKFIPLFPEDLSNLNQKLKDVLP